MSTTLKTVLVAVALTVSTAALADNIDRSSRNAATGSCQAIAAQFSGMNRDINQFRELLNRKGERLQGMDKVQYNRGYTGTLVKTITKQDLVTCAQMLDAGQI
jgi:hypothetical protein